MSTPLPPPTPDTRMPVARFFELLITLSQYPVELVTSRSRLASVCDMRVVLSSVMIDARYHYKEIAPLIKRSRLTLSYYDATCRNYPSVVRDIERLKAKLAQYAKENPSNYSNL